MSPNIHHRNAAERKIRTFKDNSLAILVGVALGFPPCLWDLLLEQTYLTLNLIHQETLSPRISSWDYFSVSFNWGATPLGSLGCHVIIHSKAIKRKSWDQWGEDGFNLGCSLKHYRCLTLINKQTNKSDVVSYTVELMHSYLTQPSLTPKYQLIQAMNILTCALKDALAVTCNVQLVDIKDIRY